MDKINIFFALLQFAQTQINHSDEKRTALDIFLKDIAIDIEELFVQLESDLISNNREAERDMYEQRNQQLQTLILSSSIMFAAMTTVIIQGILPTESTSLSIYIMALSGGMAFTLLFLSISLCVEILLQSSRFMFRRAAFYKDSLNRARGDAENIISKMKRDIGTESSVEGYGWNQKKHLELREKIMMEALAKRKDIQKSLLGDLQSFDAFWKDYCANSKMWAVISFYSGTFCTLITCGVFIQAQYSITYHNPIAAMLSIVCMSMSIWVVLIIRKHRLPFHWESNQENFQMEPTSSGRFTLSSSAPQNTSTSNVAFPSTNSSGRLDSSSRNSSSNSVFEFGRSNPLLGPSNLRTVQDDYNMMV